MKKPFKGLLIASLVVLILGVGFIAVGMASGATWQDVGITIFSGKYSFGPGDWGIGVSEIDGEGEEISGESTVLKQVDVNKLSRLNIRMEAGELDIKEAKNGYFQINNKEKRGTCFVDYEENELTISFKSKGHGKGAKATLWIPQGVSLEDLEVNVGAGKVEVENLSGENVSVDVGAGQFVVEDVKATALTIDVDAGEFKNKRKITAGTARLHVNAGNLEVNLLDAKDANLDVDMGHIDVKFSGAAIDYDIDAEVSVGEINIDGDKFYLGKEYESKNSAASKSIDVECNVGQATLDFEK